MTVTDEMVEAGMAALRNAEATHEKARFPNGVLGRYVPWLEHATRSVLEAALSVPAQGAVTPCEHKAWGYNSIDETVCHECGSVLKTNQPAHSGEREALELRLLSPDELRGLLEKAERLWGALERNELGGYSYANRPFYILEVFKEVIEDFGGRNIGYRLSPNEIDAALSVPAQEEPFAHAHKNGAIWRMDNYPAGMDFSEDGWFPLYLHPTPAHSGLRDRVADLPSDEEIQKLAASVGAKFVPYEPEQVGKEWRAKFTTDKGNTLTFHSDTREAAVTWLEKMHKPAPAHSGEREALEHALRLAQGRLSLLLRIYPDQHEDFDHPTATSCVLDIVTSALAAIEGTKP